MLSNVDNIWDHSLSREHTSWQNSIYDPKQAQS